jgi:HAMP domain-containing protein
MKKGTQLVYTALLIVLIAGAVAWILVQQREAARPELRQHAALGMVMAELTAKQLEKREKKRVVAISAKVPDPALKAQEEAFLTRLKALNPQAEIKEFYHLDPEGEKHFGPGLGLSGRRFVRLVQHNLKADVMVSFIGAPNPGSDEMRALTNKVPRFIASTRDLAAVKKLLEQHRLRDAIVPRYQFPAPGPEHPQSTREWFNRYYQIVTTNELKTLSAQ